MKTLVIATTLAAAALSIITGCHPSEDSCNIKTAGIYVQLEAIEEGSNAVGKATFWVGDDPGGTYLVLGECGDEISVNGTVLQHKSGNPEYYEAAIDPADEYDFVFSRPDEDPYSSVVGNMRPEVTVLGPSGDTIPRDEEFDITWEDNDGGEIHLLVDGDCIWDYPETLGDYIADNGSHTVPANGIEAQDEDENESCVAEIELTREVDGTLNSSLKGTIVGKSRGRSSFTTAPPAQ
jgi:hypothetical protein